MRRFEFAKISVPYRDACEDRVAVFGDEERLIVVVADGAGGIGAGDVAASRVVAEVESEYARIDSAEQWSNLLKQIDCRLAEGQSTATVVDLRPCGVLGASVGDCQAWIVQDGTIVELTQNQNRKPLLGAGDAEPVSFMHPLLQGCLLVGSDGLFNYTQRERIVSVVARSEFVTIPRACVELVRLTNGELWDDTSIVVVRPIARQKTRQRYEL